MAINAVIFTGETCAISQRTVPQFIEFARQMKAAGVPITFFEVNATRHPEVNGQWGVNQTPTIFFFDDKNILYRGVGMHDTNMLVEAARSAFRTQSAARPA